MGHATSDSLRGIERQQNAEGRTATPCRAQVDPARVRAYQRVDDGQPQTGSAAPGAGARLVGAVEATEGPSGLLAGHLGALVRELQDRVRAFGANADTNRRARRSVGDGIADEVRGDLAEPGLVTEDGGAPDRPPPGR